MEFVFSTFGAANATDRAGSRRIGSRRNMGDAAMRHKCLPDRLATARASGNLFPAARQHAPSFRQVRRAPGGICLTGLLCALKILITSCVSPYLS